MEMYKEFWMKIVDFDSKSNRREFWIPVLIHAIVLSVLQVISFFDDNTTIMIVSLLFTVIIWVPSFSVMIRRFNDTGKSKLFFLWVLFPVIGVFYVFIALVQE